MSRKTLEYAALTFAVLAAGAARAANIRMDFTTPCGAGFPSSHATLPPESGPLVAGVPRRLDPTCLPRDPPRGVPGGVAPAMVAPTWTPMALVAQHLVHPLGDIRRMVSDTSVPAYERGGSTTTGIFLEVEGGSIDPSSLPTPTPVPGTQLNQAASLDTVRAVGPGYGPSVYLINLKPYLSAGFLGLSEDYTGGTPPPPNPDYLRLYPIITAYNVVDGRGVLSATPVQGVPLQPNALYALVVTNRVKSGGAPLSRTESLRFLWEDSARPLGMSAATDFEYRIALNRLASGVRHTQYDRALDDVVALTVFATHQPAEAFRRAVNDALVLRTVDPSDPPSLDGTVLFPFSLPNPNPALYFGLEEPSFSEWPAAPGSFPFATEGLHWGIPDAGPDYSTNYTSVPAPAGVETTVDPEGQVRGVHRDGVFNEYCVFKSTIQLPLYMDDEDNSHTGTWSADPTTGVPVRKGESRAVRIFVTIPRKPMPPDGYPVVVFSRSGGGGDVPLVSHSPSNTRYFSSELPGAGPALHFARAGWAGVQIDNHLGGWRRGRAQKSVDHEEDGLFTHYTYWDWSWGTEAENDKIYDLFHLEKMRDNIRQGGLDLVIAGAKTLRFINLHPELFDATTCTIRGDAPAPALGDPGPCAMTNEDALDANGGPHAGADPLHFTAGLFPNLGPGNFSPVRATCLPTSRPGPAGVRFDLTRLAYMGNSNGAHLGPLALSAVYPSTWPGGFGTAPGQPIFKYAIMGGAQGSLLMNVLYKSMTPVEIPNVAGLNDSFFADRYFSIRDLVESRFLLDRPLRGPQDEALNAFQLSQNTAETQNYSRIVADRTVGASPAQVVLQFQGVLDHYIPPPVGNPANLALGLGLANRAADPTDFYPSADANLAVYDDRTGLQRWLHPNGPIARGADFASFMPFNQLQLLSGWGSTAGAIAGRGLGTFTTLPAVNTSLVVQHSNGPIMLRSHGTRFGIPDPFKCLNYLDAFTYLFHVEWLPIFVLAGLPTPPTPFLPGITNPANALNPALLGLPPAVGTMMSPGGECFPSHVVYPPGNYPAYRWQDGHEIIFQSSQARLQYQCFLESARGGAARIIDTRPVGQDYTSCALTCAHPGTVQGPPLNASCDCRVAMTCASPATAYCCTSTWDGPCITAFNAAESSCFGPI